MNGVVLLHSEPPEARMPRARWRLYVFKGEAEAQPPLMLHTASSYLLGRERRVATIPTDHLSCSKQARASASVLGPSRLLRCQRCFCTRANARCCADVARAAHTACGAAVAADGEDGRGRHAARRRAPVPHGACRASQRASHHARDAHAR